MGLDSVELLVEVEKTFDIEIPDAEAEKIATVGDFYEAVWDKIKDKTNNKCLSAMLFYRFRMFLSKRYPFPLKDFKPEANLNDLIPKEFRKEQWKEIQEDFDYELPDLALPQWLQSLVFYLGVTIIIGPLAVGVIAVNFYDASKWLFLLPAIGIIIMILLNLLLKPLRTDIREKNIRRFIEETLTMNYKKLRLAFGANRPEMEVIMNNLIHDKSGVDFAEIKPEALIANDLGIN